MEEGTERRRLSARNMPFHKIQEQQHVAVGPGNAHFISILARYPTRHAAAPHVRLAAAAEAAAATIRQFTE